MGLVVSYLIYYIQDQVLSSFPVALALITAVRAANPPSVLAPVQPVAQLVVPLRQSLDLSISLMVPAVELPAMSVPVEIAAHNTVIG
jgi:hypothetical protein